MAIHVNVPAFRTGERIGGALIIYVGFDFYKETGIGRARRYDRIRR